jgi:hypothetical protein
MSKNRAKAILEILTNLLLQPRKSFRVLRGMPAAADGYDYGQEWKSSFNGRRQTSAIPNEISENDSDPMKSYFDSHTQGRGIWKWTHYFDIYHRHFSKFIGREVHVLEIGIYSGGSLTMWKEYFGQQCYVYGVDIEEACKVYADERTKIFIGDQQDRNFWTRIKPQIPLVDILIDDGGHEPEQQIATLEEMLPHLRPGGLYLCEDVHGSINGFNSYLNGLTAQLNASVRKVHDKEKGIVCSPTQFQADIHSIHFYPFVTVIEKTHSPVAQFAAPKHGTEWQPFL